MPKFMSTILSAIALTLVPAAVPADAQDAKPKIVRSKPAQPVEIDGVPCAAGYVFRVEGTGRLTSARSTATRSCATPTCAREQPWR